VSKTTKLFGVDTSKCTCAGGPRIHAELAKLGGSTEVDPAFCYQPEPDPAAESASLRATIEEQRQRIEELAKEINRWELAVGFPEATPEALSERLTALAEAVAQAESERDALREAYFHPICLMSPEVAALCKSARCNRTIRALARNPETPKAAPCRRCGLPYLEGRVCSGSGFSLPCAETQATEAAPRALEPCTGFWVGGVRGGPHSSGVRLAHNEPCPRHGFFTEQGSNKKGKE
jgi:hypothetical protein